MDRGYGDSLSPPDGDGDFEHDSPHSLQSHSSTARSVEPEPLDSESGGRSGHHSTSTSSRDALATTGKAGREPKRRRACEACRRLKVQCNFESSRSDTCKRCLKAGRECVVLERRRRQVVANSVTELEKKLEALTATLNAMKANPEHAAAAGADGDKSGDPQTTRASSRGDGKGNSEGVDDKSGLMAPSKSGDVVDRGFISWDEAMAVFDHFVHNMLPHLPIVLIPSEATAQGIRQTKPILFLAILGAGSWILTVKVQRVINQELMRTLSERILVIGEKSLELIQAIQICTVWYFPPGRFEELKYYQYTHNACVMAIDIGLNRRGVKAKPTIPELAAKAAKRRNIRPDSSSMESRRAWLGCYLIGSLSAQNFRRENLIRYSSFIEESLELLETSPDAAKSDAVLCQWVRLQHLADDVAVEFSIEDPESSDDLGVSKVRFAVQGFESQLKKITSMKLPEEKLPSLILSELHSKLYMHEVALHAGYNCNDDMQPPFTEDALATLRPTQAAKLSAGHIASLSTCLVAMHAFFDTLLDMSVDVARNIPNFSFVRTMYAAIALTKLAYDTTFPDSEIGKMFSQDDFKVDPYFEKLQKKLVAIAGDDHHATAKTFVMIIGNLRGVYRALMSKRTTGEHRSETDPDTSRSSTEVISNKGPPIQQQRQQWQALDHTHMMMQHQQHSQHQQPRHSTFGMGPGMQHAPNMPMTTSPSVTGLTGDIMSAYAPPQTHNHGHGHGHDAMMGEPAEFSFAMGGAYPMYFSDESMMSTMVDMMGPTQGFSQSPWPPYRDNSRHDGS